MGTMNARYVTVRRPSESEDAILIPPWGVHFRPETGEVIGAGEFTLTVVDGRIKVKCFGRSDGIDVESRGEKDAVLVEQFLRLGDFEEA
jgi:hypothetical protein